MRLIGEWLKLCLMRRLSFPGIVPRRFLLFPGPQTQRGGYPWGPPIRNSETIGPSVIYLDVGLSVVTVYYTISDGADKAIPSRSIYLEALAGCRIGTSHAL